MPGTARRDSTGWNTNVVMRFAPVATRYHAPSVARKGRARPLGANCIRGTRSNTLTITSIADTAINEVTGVISVTDRVVQPWLRTISRVTVVAPHVFGHSGLEGVGVSAGQAAYGCRWCWAREPWGAAGSGAGVTIG